MSQDDQRLKIAVQKKGRLAEESIRLLGKCGIHLTRSRDQLFCRSSNFPVDVFFVRDDDIPAFVSSDVCQVGIVGQNVLLEKQARAGGEFGPVETVLALGFGRCRLSLAVPQGTDYAGPESLAGKTIATSYKGVLADYLAKNDIEAQIVSMQGAVEIAPRTEMADAICDLVSTGSTLALNGLTEKETILESEAVLIRNHSLTPAQQDSLDRITMRLKGALRAENSKYIMLHSPKDNLAAITAALPGRESPTILPLEGADDKVAVHAVCEEDVFWSTMEDLKAKGASAILVLPIEKMLG